MGKEEDEEEEEAIWTTSNLSYFCIDFLKWSSTCIIMREKWKKLLPCLHVFFLRIVGHNSNKVSENSGIEW